MNIKILLNALNAFYAFFGFIGHELCYMYVFFKAFVIEICDRISDTKAFQFKLRGGAVGEVRAQVIGHIGPRPFVNRQNDRHE